MEEWPSSEVGDAMTPCCENPNWVGADSIGSICCSMEAVELWREWVATGF